MGTEQFKKEQVASHEPRNGDSEATLCRSAEWQLSLCHWLSAICYRLFAIKVHGPNARAEQVGASHEPPSKSVVAVPRWSRRRLGLAAALTGSLLCCLSGCSSSRTAPLRTQSPPAAIERLNMICRAVTVDFDTIPGPDGIGVTLYASNREAPKTVKIAAGTVQILLFDGILKDSEIASTPPLWVWTFTAEDLKRLSFSGSIGICYPLRLRWGDARPTQNRMTVVARYTPPTGPVLQTQPSIISMTQ